MSMENKSVNLDAQFQPMQCSTAQQYFDEDLLSQLPDEILIKILSSIPTEETARTSVLSSRWINLWNQTSKLDFDASESVDKSQEKLLPDEIEDELEPLDYESRNEERLRFVKWVDTVLQSHNSLALDEFRVRCDLDKFFTKSIDKWIKYAFERKIQSLELDFKEYTYYHLRRSRTTYAFPEKFLNQSTNLLKSLKSLSLKSVNISSEGIHVFIQNCPFLEQLTVVRSEFIQNLEFCGPSLVLKHVEIRYCAIKSIKVINTNIISLTVHGFQEIFLENVPMLVDLNLQGGSFCNFYDQLFSCLSSWGSQLEVLTLKASEVKDNMDRFKFLELTKLKKLEVVFVTEKDESLLGVTSLIRVCPYLEEFILKLHWFGPRRTTREVIKAIASPLPYLKIFNFSGYYGRTTDIEIVNYILENAVVLEQIIIDPSDKSNFKTIEEVEEEDEARDYAKQQLEEAVPESVELIII